jgi:hypothetical protein
MTSPGLRSPLLFRVSGVFLIIGLSIEAVSLHWIHPLAFLSFFVVGGTCLAAGILLFLYSVLIKSAASGRDNLSPH